MKIYLRGGQQWVLVRAIVSCVSSNADIPRRLHRRSPRMLTGLHYPASERFIYTRNDGTATEELDQAIQRRFAS